MIILQMLYIVLSTLEEKSVESLWPETRGVHGEFSTYSTLYERAAKVCEPVRAASVPPGQRYKWTLKKNNKQTTAKQTDFSFSF